MRTFLVVLILLLAAWPAAAQSIEGRVIDVDRQQNTVTLAVTAQDGATERQRIQVKDLPADIQLGNLLSVEASGVMANGTAVASAVKNKSQGLRSASADQTGVRSRLRKAQSGGNSLPGLSQGKGLRRGRN